MRCKRPSRRPGTTCRRWWNRRVETTAAPVDRRTRAAPTDGRPHAPGPNGCLPLPASQPDVSAHSCTFDGNTPPGRLATVNGHAHNPSKACTIRFCRTGARRLRRSFHVPRFTPRTSHDESAYPDRSRPARRHDHLRRRRRPYRPQAVARAVHGAPALQPSARDAHHRGRPPRLGHRRLSQVHGRAVASVHRRKGVRSSGLEPFPRPVQVRADRRERTGRLPAARGSARGDAIRVFYLSTSPELFTTICDNLSAAHLVDKHSRVVLEKPLGHDSRPRRRSTMRSASTSRNRRSIGSTTISARKPCRT